MITLTDWATVDAHAALAQQQGEAAYAEIGAAITLGVVFTICVLVIVWGIRHGITRANDTRHQRALDRRNLSRQIPRQRDGSDRP